MKIDSRFQTRPNTDIQLSINSQPFSAKSNDTVAAALLAHSGNASRISAKDTPRTAFCMMGVCFDCLVEIDGYPNVQACMTPVREGMIIRSQQGLRTLNKSTDDG